MPKKILVVDDDPVGVALMSARLSGAGYTAAKALNGQLGLDAAKAERPDLIVLDIEMPEMNGYTFVVELRKIEEFRAIPIIVLTAHEENKAIFHRRGIEHYLVKPVNFDELFSKIDILIGKAE